MRPPREDTEPWYKQFWPWFLISLPASVVVAAIVTINLAIETDDGLVSDDYYKEGLAIHKDAAISSRAKALGIAGRLAYESETSAVSFALDRPLPAPTAQLTLLIVHPTLPNRDQQVQLTAMDDRRYIGRVSPLEAASWKLKLFPEEESWRIEGRLQLPGSADTALD